MSKLKIKQKLKQKLKQTENVGRSRIENHATRRLLEMLQRSDRLVVHLLRWPELSKLRKLDHWWPQWAKQDAKVESTSACGAPMGQSCHLASSSSEALSCSSLLHEFLIFLRAERKFASPLSDLSDACLGFSSFFTGVKLLRASFRAEGERQLIVAGGGGGTGGGTGDPLLIIIATGVGESGSPPWWSSPVCFTSPGGVSCWVLDGACVVGKTATWGEERLQKN